MKKHLLLFDLDDTLLRSDKTISERTLDALRRRREKGELVGVCTSRSEQNSLPFLAALSPDILISSGGAVVKYQDQYLYTAEFTEAETNRIIGLARSICGIDCEITVDTRNHHYWNYKADPNISDSTWGESVYTDYRDFHEKALKICVEIFHVKAAQELSCRLPECDCIKFHDGCWYKFTKKEATKENAIKTVCAACGISLENITAFGNDLADIGMLTLCGTGIAMGNALPEVKAAANLVIGCNDSDGIADYLEDL